MLLSPPGVLRASASCATGGAWRSGGPRLCQGREGFQRLRTRCPRVSGRGEYILHAGVQRG
eukprot:2308853-Prorocentrum_lima.AAC.1